ncbi:hypothetical protein BK748_15365 [Bacillus thuringiensis serovar graciosensis]|nr:hypothetical protein BK748_15365 [Bacillus thuringiensis serovar graciosensis]
MTDIRFYFPTRDLLNQSEGRFFMIGLELIVKLKGMEFKEVAEFLELAPQTVSDWVKGKRKVPSKRAFQLANHFSVDADLIGKEIDKEDEMKIYYSLGKIYDGIGMRSALNEGNIEIGEENEMTYEQLSLISDEELDITNVGTVKDLEDQISEERKELKTETKDVTISELMNMYAVRNVLDIHPEFQRLFRWSMKQKTKLIESIILGIPIPPLFVAEDENAAWDVIDGVQRLSTIFEFLGVLRDEDEELVEPSVLVGTEKLKALEGKVWNNKHPKHTHRFSFEQGKSLANKFLGATLKVIVVGNESNPKAKYDIFDRLNTGGSKLTEQEVRNCLAIMINRNFYTWLRTLSLNPTFVSTLPISDNLVKKQRDIEYVLRFMIYRNIDQLEYSLTDDIHDVLTEKMQDLCLEDSLDYMREKEIFDKTFELLNEALEGNAFKKYFKEEERFKGAVSLSSFEIIAIGIAENLNYITSLDNPIEYIADKVKELYSSEEYNSIQNVISGRAVTRFTILTELGKKYFAQ